MAAEPQAGAVSAAFPAPPPFYKSFTPNNIERLQHFNDPASQTSIETQRSSGPSIPSISDPTSLPAELHHLIPPAPPSDGKYRSFGILHDINPPTSIPHRVPTRENLLNLTDRLMRLYHRYVQILATNPSGELWVPQWEEIKRTFEEVHKVINEYRPHEARESLILRYEDQIKEIVEETEKVKRTVERARKVMSQLGSGILKDGDLGTNGAGMGLETVSPIEHNNQNRAIARETAVFNMVESEVGGA